ncbi:oocyte zinc finger protein XlCOF6.1-like isoform X3 [Bacillus rossius redtenbacheri]|uniref:oocyte zinc finger protein XlCOF6.1-like isoform X3 n=1 Tax=Bacillus rossius redtenbacheri TaxID=93214 RepID=UPI002FDEA582
MAEGVCIKDDPAETEPFETVILPIKEEFKSEDKNDGDQTSAGTTLAPLETVDQSRVKDESTVEDSQAWEQPEAAASPTGLLETNELLCIKTEKTEKEKDVKPSVRGDNLSLPPQSSSSFQPVSLVTLRLSYERKNQGLKQSLNYNTGPGLFESNASATDGVGRTFSCSQCPAMFAQKCNLILHIRTHAGEKPFSCSLCSAKYISESCLNAHLRTHTSDKPFSCLSCSAKFTRMSNLNLHLRTHTSEKPFSCSHCSSRFTKRGQLIVHLRTHTNEKPFSCSLCSAKFKSNGSLKKHMRTHTGIKPLSCSSCSAVLI